MVEKIKIIQGSLPYREHLKKNKEMKTGEASNSGKGRKMVRIQERNSIDTVRDRSRKNEHQLTEQLNPENGPLSLTKLFDKSLLAELVTEDTWMDRLRRVVERNDRQ